jgi:O-antigen/teichoic acid export membrane protein
MMIKEYLKDARIRQVILLLSINIVTIPIGIITNIVITKFLGPKAYGDYQFLLNIFYFAIILFSLGFLQAGNRAIVLTKENQTIKEYYGAELAIMFVIFIFMTCGLLVFSVFDKNLNNKGIEDLFFFLLPVGWVFLIGRYYEVLFQADNRIGLLAITRLVPKLFMLFFAILIYFQFIPSFNSNLELVLFVTIFFQIILFVFIIIKLKASFRNYKKRIKELIGFNKSYGFDVYLGSIFSTGFYELTGLLISYFSLDNKGVGFYTLALTFAMPLSVIPNTIATTQYKEFSTRDKIPVKLMWITLALTLTGLILLWVIITPFVNRFYSSDFSEVITLTYIVSLGILGHGLADFFNRYLGANGQGKALKYSSFIIGISLFLLSLILIPVFRETGAAYARFGSGLIYLIVIIYFYRDYVKKKKLTSDLNIVQNT